MAARLICERASGTYTWTHNLYSSSECVLNQFRVGVLSEYLAQDVGANVRRKLMDKSIHPSIHPGRLEPLMHPPIFVWPMRVWRVHRSPP